MQMLICSGDEGHTQLSIVDSIRMGRSNYAKWMSNIDNAH